MLLAHLYMISGVGRRAPMVIRYWSKPVKTMDNMGPRWEAVRTTTLLISAAFQMWMVALAEAPLCSAEATHFLFADTQMLLIECYAITRRGREYLVFEVILLMVRVRVVN